MQSVGYDEEGRTDIVCWCGPLRLLYLKEGLCAFTD